MDAIYERYNLIGVSPDETHALYCQRTIIAKFYTVK